MRIEYRKSNLEQRLIHYNEWLEKRTILLGYMGDYARGIQVKSSVLEYYGVFIPPQGDTTKEINIEFQGKYKITKVHLVSLDKFMEHFFFGLPKNLEFLFQDTDNYLKLTEPGQILLDNKRLLLTQVAIKQLRQQALFEQQKLEDSQKEYSKYIYDRRALMNEVYYLTAGIQIAVKGTFSTYTKNREFLRQCLDGFFPLAEAKGIVKNLFSQYEGVTNITWLTKVPDLLELKRITQVIKNDFPSA